MSQDNELSDNIFFSSLTTLKIGGPVKYFVTASLIDEIVQSIERAKSEDLSYIVIGGGSNLLVSDKGFDGLVIQNSVGGIENVGKTLEVGAGTSLQELVDFANESGAGGFEKLAGIPGTVGGAVFGNAGAYGQTISDNLLGVEVIEPESGTLKKLNKKECRFTYRDSEFKRTKNIILTIGFSVREGDPEELKKISGEIIAMRMQKYHPDIACPGSFFKNVEIDKLSPEVLKNIPEDKIIFGKIPAGWLLDAVGAKGAKRGGVEIATWHGNLFMNTGGGTAEDFVVLAKEYKQKVKEKFGIDLEPEVQLIGFENNVL